MSTDEREPHESHRWVGNGECGSSEHGLMCGDCGVDINDDEATEACRPLTEADFRGVGPWFPDEESWR